MLLTVVVSSWAMDHGLWSGEFDGEPNENEGHDEEGNAGWRPVC